MKAAKTLVLMALLIISTINLHAYPIPDTGQMKCYSNFGEITCPTAGQPFYGQDGNYSINPPSYTKLDASGNTLPDSAISWVMAKDNVTGLIWENKTNDGSIHDISKYFTWCDKNSATNGGDPGTCGTGTGDAATDTEAFIKALNDTNFGGFSDWRLPRLKELKTVANYEYGNPQPNTAWFPNTEGRDHWSATTKAGDATSAWTAYYGYDSASVKRGGAPTIAVRGKQNSGEFVDNGDGTVTDTSTGLMWQQQTLSKMTWEAALAHAENLSLAGYVDWRLPKITELQSIVDFNRYSPAIYTDYFPGTEPYYYWSSTTQSYYNVWCGAFSDGRAASMDKSASPFYARSVRGSQNRIPGNLVITVPNQANKLALGSQKIIIWDTAGISGNVKITLSRQGGKTGTFTEIITESVPNNGSYAWTVTGPTSVNCVLKIEPLSDATKGTTQGLFSIMTSSSGTIDLPKTGQTKCYDTAGTEISCTGTGQDGAIQAGAAFPSPRFANPDGTAPINGNIVLDKLTGLEWPKDAGTPAAGSCTGGTKTWQQALDYVACLNTNNYLGHNYWRLPNINELENFLNVEQTNIAAWLNTQGFANVQAAIYWSSTTASFDTSASTARGIYIQTGFVNESYVGKTGKHYVWPVRSGSYPGAIGIPKTGQTTSYAAGDDGDLEKGVAWPSPRFTDNNNGTVTDNLTGLIWLKNANCFGTGTWSQALTSSNSLPSGSCGLADGSSAGAWRLPNRKELKSLVDAEKKTPALPDGHPFSNVQNTVNGDSSIYWSSTTYPIAPSYDWGFTMGDGHMDPFHGKTGSGYSWPVRGGNANSQQTTSYILDVVKTASGTGTVTASSGTIAWIGNAGTASYPGGTQIILTATADLGSTFTGWSGACTGADTCQVTMDAAKSVTAAFADTSAGMVLIPAGSFQMGDNFSEGNTDERPLHSVAVNAFYLDKYEVTKALWDEVYTWAIAHSYTFDNTGTGTAAYHPVQTISWYDIVKWLNARSEKEGRTPLYYTDTGQAVVYRTGRVDVAAGAVKWAANGYRLPTEAEWEYAARGGTTARFYTGDCISADTQANYDGRYPWTGCPAGQNRGATTAVGSFPANPWGLYDMAGNVREWIWDWFGSYSSSSATNPKGPDSGSSRMVRGGGWIGGAVVLRSAGRYDYSGPTGGNSVMGFRSALSLQQSSFNLTINKSGTGTGNVTPDSGTVTWTGNTGTGEYSTGSNVTLTATPEAGSTFAGWSGDCSGTGTCSLAMLSNRNVMATFTLIPVDNTPPTGAAVVINGGAASTGATQVTLTLSATDTGSGMGQMKFSDNGTTWSTPVPFSATASWTLSSGDGQKSVYALFSDKAGNWMASSVSATILLQTQSAPGNPSGLLVESTTNSSVSLKWNKNSETGAVYHLFRSQTEGGIFYPVNTLPVGDESLSYGKLTFTDRGLKEGTTYYYKIRAVAGGVSSAGFSNVVSAKTTIIEDYQVVAVDPTNIVNVGSAVKYYLQILPKDRFRGTINLSCSGVSNGLIYEFLVNGESKGSSVSVTSLPASVVLQITAGSATEIREHRFEVLTQNVWTGGASDLRHTPLSLTVIARDGAGIHTEVEKSLLRKGEKVKIYGSILPPVAGKTVVLTLTPGNRSSQTRNVTTTLGGKFEEGDWISTLPIDSYEITAAFTDAATLHTSDSRAFTVEKGAVVLTCLRKTGEQGAIGSDFTITGALKPAVPYTEITLRAIDPDGIVSDRTFAVDADGQYLRRESYFTKNGIWKFRAYFAGNDDTIGTESDDLVVPVGIDIGRAIILGGGEAAQSNTYWDVTKKLTVAAYRDFKSKGFLKEMIYYLINSQTVDINYDDIPDDVVNVTTPSVAAFLDAIRTRYAAVLDAQTPLFIYMQGHATQDKRFKILGTDEFLTSAQMKDALDKLQGVGAYQGQGGVESNIIVIIETCYSGNFIADLSGLRRVIVTSAGNEPYNTDATGQISFSRRLFSKLLEGDSLKKAFDYARSAQVNMNYPSPHLDDNGDGTDNATDGLLASNIHLNGALTWGLKPIIGAGAVNMAAVIEGVASTPISVNVTKGDVNIERVWAQIIAPNANIGGGTETIAYPEITLTLNTATQRYEGQLTGLTVSGIYKIVVVARDVNKDVSDPALAYITVASPPPPGGDVNGDGDVTLADAILALKVLGGIAPSLGTPGGIRADYATSGADVNGDKKIGLAEVVYILQKVAEVR